MALSFLSQIKVRSKLTLGFAVVLLLTLFIALCAWWSLNNLNHSNKQLSSIDEVEKISHGLEYAVLSYRSTGQEADRELVSKLIQQMEGIIRETGELFTQDFAARRVRELYSLGSPYQQAFSELVKAMQDRAQHSAQQGQAGAAVIEAFSVLEHNLVDNQEFDTQTALELTRWTFENYRDVLLGRFLLVRYEQARHDLSLQQRGIDMSRQVLASLEAMSARFDHQDVRLLNGQQALQDYLAAYDKVAAAFIAEDKAVATMVQTNERLRELSAELQGLLAEQRVEQMATAQLTIMIATLVALLLGIVVANVITQQIVVPLRESLAAADRIASGDLSERQLTRRDDEFGDLEQRMALMRDNLRDLISHIEASTNQIASAAQELSAVTVQTSEGAQRQLDETSLSGQGMQEMTATVQDVARNAELASVAADNADHEAQNVARLAGETLAQINAMTAQVERSMQVMQQLQQESEKIGSVLDVIKNVAEQTNLLALNAAIEAARAGEQGRGFAVVADEVRALAKRTQQSAQEIETLIGGLQGGTQQAVEAMMSGREMSSRTLLMGQSTGNSIEAITQMVSEIQSMNRQIATAADQQTSVANELTRGVISVREISEQTAVASNQTATASHRLAQLGSELQVLIRRFRI